MQRLPDISVGFNTNYVLILIMDFPLKLKDLASRKSSLPFIFLSNHTLPTLIFL